MIAMSLITVDVAAPLPYAEIMGVIGLVLNVAFIMWASYLVAVHSSGIVSRWLRKARGLVQVVEQRGLCNRVCFSGAKEGSRGSTGGRHNNFCCGFSASIKGDGSGATLACSNGSNTEISVSKSVGSRGHHLHKVAADTDVEAGPRHS
jgi:hypothetical protein